MQTKLFIHSKTGAVVGEHIGCEHFNSEFGSYIYTLLCGLWHNETAFFLIIRSGPVS